MHDSKTKQEPWYVRFWPAIVIGAAWCFVFWPMMSGQTVVGYRDSAYLYYPLFKWIDSQWAMGEIPLWNRFCNFGIPVVGDGTSSLFYPGKLLFFFRFLPYPARYGIYLAIHIPIAANGAYWLSRVLGSNRAGGTLAAFSYAFGGSVLFQVTNVVYLVSAAWLPFALGCIWLMEKRGQARWAVGAGVASAMMILGGDPQMVYHVGLIALATTACGWFRRRVVPKQRADNSLQPNRTAVGAGTRMITLVMVTVLLSAVQLLPSYSWAQHSERAHPETPANIYMAATRMMGQVKEDRGFEFGDSLWGPPRGTMSHAYQFSQPPWRLVELVWPNFSGKPFPVNQRWTRVFPGTDRIWNPSLYMGVLVCLIGVSGIRLWGHSRPQVWLTRVMLFFGVASFGWYGGVWLLNECLPAEVSVLSAGPQVGGVYWAMNLLLPKYFVFRYPAKLFVIASLGLSLLAGNRLRRTNFGLSRRMVAISMVVLGLGSVALLYFRPAVLNSGVPADVLFGPFDITGSTRELYVSLIQPFAAIICMCGVVYFIKGRPESRRSTEWAGLGLVVITVVDVIFANRWLVPEVSSSTLELQTKIHPQIVQMREATKSQRDITIYRSRVASFEPESWIKESSHRRLNDIITWQKETLAPKHHLAERVVLIGSFSSIWPVTYEEYLTDWERFEFDLDQVAKIADGAIVKIPGEPAKLIDLTADRVDAIPENVNVANDAMKGRMEFLIGAWISACSWVLLLLICFAVSLRPVPGKNLARQ